MCKAPSPRPGRVQGLGTMLGGPKVIRPGSCSPPLQPKGHLARAQRMVPPRRGSWEQGHPRCVQSTGSCRHVDLGSSGAGAYLGGHQGTRPLLYSSLVVCTSAPRVGLDKLGRGEW